MIVILLVLLAGILNACMDTLSFHYSTSIFRFWKNQNWVNPTLSWHNKDKSTSKFIRLIMSTVLVFTTDLWHLCKFLMLLLLFTAVVFYQPIVNWYVDIFGLYCIFTVTFEIFFSKVLVKK